MPRMPTRKSQEEERGEEYANENRQSSNPSHNLARERDEEGRFMSEDEERGSSRRNRSSRDYDDDYRMSRMPPRDEEGRFMSEDEEDEDEEGGRYRRSPSGSRRYSSSSRSGRGWYGDPEGLSRSSREGWGEEDEEYRPSRSRRNRSRYEEDEDYYSSGSRSNPSYSSSSGPRRHGGWYGDPEGHARASREGWDNPSHRPSGWFGDPAGHSRASREGWENPEHRPSGWFGDPEGHREAAERGWEHGHRGQRASRSSRRDYAYEGERYARRRSGNRD